MFVVRTADNLHRIWWFYPLVKVDGTVMHRSKKKKVQNKRDNKSNPSIWGWIHQWSDISPVKSNRIYATPFPWSIRRLASRPPNGPWLRAASGAVRARWPWAGLVSRGRETMIWRCGWDQEQLENKNLKPKDNLRSFWVERVDLGWFFFFGAFCGKLKNSMAMLVMGCFDFWGPATEGSERFSWKLILLPVLSLGNSSVFRTFVVLTPFLLHAVGMFYLSLCNWACFYLEVRAYLSTRNAGNLWEECEVHCWTEVCLGAQAERKTINPTAVSFLKKTAITLFVMKGLDTVRDHTTLFHRNPDSYI